MALPKRKDVPKELTWDVTAIYADDSDFYTDLEVAKTLTQEFVTNYQGKLNSATKIVAALKPLEVIETKLSWLSHYAFLQQASDMTDPHFNQLLRDFSHTEAEISAQLTFFENEVLTNDVATLEAVGELDTTHANLVRTWKRSKKHLLTPEVEQVLASLNPVFAGQENLYTTARAADFDMPDFEVDGVKYPMSFVLYENTYQYHPNPKVRHKAHKIFSDVLRQHQNTIAVNYYNQVLKEKTMATMRGFDSVIDYLLDGQEISREMFDRQIDLIINQLGPIMQKYVKLIQSEHGLDKMTYSDLQIALDPDFTYPTSLDDAKKYMTEALKPLGSDYLNSLMPAFKERWIDFVANAGKESGGFETTPYGLHPYILMSWTDTLPDAYTLVHELGHAGNFIAINKHNPILAGEPSLYLIEAPSTYNELLLTHYFESQNPNPRALRFAYTTMLTNTYFHNFITHLLEAAYQREVYRLIDAGQGFDGAKLTEIKMQVQKQFWGDAVDIDEDAGLTWMRQSHYYMGLYSYTYSAGLTISTQAYLQYLDEGQTAIDRWLEFLALGDQKAPLEAAKIAGVDVSTKEPLENTIAFLGQTVEKIIKLTKEIKA